MGKWRISVIFTCYNRREKSVCCVKSLIEGNPSVDFDFIVVDDASTDGTKEALCALTNRIEVIDGTGGLYWCGGMRVGIEHYLTREDDSDYCLFVNDDVDFYPHAIEKMIERQAGREDYVVVGATCDKKGKFSYGLRTKRKWYQKGLIDTILPSDEEIIGKTMNANAVLLPWKVAKNNGNFDKKYTHSIGDYDYGFRLTKRKIKLISTADYVGVCSDNSIEGTWLDKTLSRRERLKKKKSPKGSPFGEWWHFLIKNYGFFHAVFYSFLPYMKILFKK